MDSFDPGGRGEDRAAVSVVQAGDGLLGALDHVAQQARIGRIEQLGALLGAHHAHLDGHARHVRSGSWRASCRRTAAHRWARLVFRVANAPIYVERTTFFELVAKSAAGSVSSPARFGSASSQRYASTRRGLNRNCDG